MTHLTLELVRVRGMRMLALGNWIASAGILAGGLVIASPHTVVAVAVAALVSIAPTAMAVAGRGDAPARLACAGPVAVLPAALVYLLAGHAWQMDAHMYFFVSLASLMVLCDWRPIVLAAALIAAHHLLLDYAMPDWVFSGSGDFARVMFHAVAVICQTAVLCYVTWRLRALILAQDAARRDSDAMTQAAEHARDAAAVDRQRAVEALDALRIVEGEATTARTRRIEADRRAAAVQQASLIQFAEQFEDTVAGVAVAIETAAATLEGAATALSATAAQAGREASDVATGAAKASVGAQDVADSIRRLTGSMADVSRTALGQTELSRSALDNARNGDAALRTLATRAEAIGAFVGEINGIATRTNLLALNASIEAARAGAAGQGFAVVAGEVKQLASGTALATDHIVDLIARMDEGVGAATGNLGAATVSVDAVAAAAEAIRDAVETQLAATAEIERIATNAARDADLIERRIAGVATATTAAGGLSIEVRDAVGSLSEQARRLRRSTDHFVERLRGGG